MAFDNALAIIEGIGEAKLNFTSYLSLLAVDLNGLNKNFLRAFLLKRLIQRYRLITYESITIERYVIISFLTKTKINVFGMRVSRCEKVIGYNDIAEYCKIL